MREPWVTIAIIVPIFVVIVIALILILVYIVFKPISSSTGSSLSHSSSINLLGFRRRKTFKPILPKVHFRTGPRPPFASFKTEGRLGNRLFQTAAIYSYAADNELEFLLPKDIDGPFFELFNRLDDSDFSKIGANYTEPSFGFKSLPKGMKNVEFRGYYQSCKYFDHHREELLELFQLPDREYNQVKERYNQITSSLTDGPKSLISLHIRRGDYTENNGTQYVLPISYYQRALRNFDPKTSVAVVFSDDIPDCRNVLPKKFPNWTFYFVDAGEDWSDLYLMSLCDHNIIANSSYSWWGAYLNNNPSKRVFGPAQWFTARCKLDFRDVIPSYWTKL
jgi:hypothetical protein